MRWSTCFTPQRVGEAAKTSGIRSHYQRDFDRLIFSSPFRRLQSKTQVFPLPGSTFVHNRLTHSLEVASVGRSLGSMVGEHIANLPGLSEDVQRFYKIDLSNIIAAACLAHDIGNPAFGHSGEDAISNYFSKYQNTIVEGAGLKSYFTSEEWADLTQFEGNANALRVLTQNFKGKAEGGIGLTMTTLASILKYPCSSSQRSKAKHRKKYSYFQSEKEIFFEITKELEFVPDNEASGVFRRHPFVYLVEAADDICYRIVDVEDAHRLGIVSIEKIRSLFLQVIKDINRPDDSLSTIQQKLDTLTDDNAAVSYLRAKVISTLINSSVDEFLKHKEEILEGTYDSTLLDAIEAYCPTLQLIERLSIDKIYNHPSVVEVEIAGYNVMSELLQLFVPAVLSTKPSAFEKQAIKLIPFQYKAEPNDRPYLKVMNVLDHVSAMTDSYATDLYRKIKGIEISKHR
jgi:dGTPase